MIILTLSHLSTHLAWNSWLHGNTRTSWRLSKSHMHTTHDDWSIEDRFISALYRYEGNCSISGLPRPRGLASPRRSARFNKAWNIRTPMITMVKQMTAKSLSNWLHIFRIYIGREQTNMKFMEGGHIAFSPKFLRHYFFKLESPHLSCRKMQKIFSHVKVAIANDGVCTLAPFLVGLIIKMTTLT